MLYSCFISRLATFTITHIYDHDKCILRQSSTYSTTLLVLPSYMSHPVIYSDMDEPTPKRAIYIYTRPPLNTRPIHKPSKSTSPPRSKRPLCPKHTQLFFKPHFFTTPLPRPPAPAARPRRSACDPSPRCAPSSRRRAPACARRRRSAQTPRARAARGGCGCTRCRPWPSRARRAAAARC